MSVPGGGDTAAIFVCHCLLFLSDASRCLTRSPVRSPKEIAAHFGSNTNEAGGWRCHLKLDLEKSWKVFFFFHSSSNKYTEAVFSARFSLNATMNFHLGTGEALKHLGSLLKGRWLGRFPIGLRVATPPVNYAALALMPRRFQPPKHWDVRCFPWVAEFPAAWLSLQRFPFFSSKMTASALIDNTEQLLWAESMFCWASGVAQSHMCLLFNQ